MLNFFENKLKNIANDKMLMSYGNNMNVVNNMLSVISMVKSISGIIQTDRMNDMFLMNVATKIAELENIIAMFGPQRLMGCGINMTELMGGGQPPMSPFMANSPMYNQQVYYPNNAMMGGMQYNPMMSGGQMGYMQQSMYQPQQQMQNMPQQAPQMQKQTAQPVQSALREDLQMPMPPAGSPKGGGGDKGGSGGGVMMGIPGVGGGTDEKASGRDYLLKLLSDSEK